MTRQRFVTYAFTFAVAGLPLSGVASAQDRTSNGNTTGSAVPRGDGAAAAPPRHVAAMAAGRVPATAAAAQQQQRIEWGCRRHELRLVVALLDVQFSAGDVVRVFPAPALERSGNAVARRREQHWVGHTAGWILHAQRW